MEFGTVVIIVAVVAVVVAAISYRGAGGIYSRLGREGGLEMTRPAPEDSGCPRMVTCVWRGRLRIRALVRGTGQVTLDDGVPIRVASGRLTLIDAVPISQRGELAPRGAYRFRLRFER